MVDSHNHRKQKMALQNRGVRLIFLSTECKIAGSSVRNPIYLMKGCLCVLDTTRLFGDDKFEANERKICQLKSLERTTLVSLGLACRRYRIFKY